MEVFVCKKKIKDKTKPHAKSPPAAFQPNMQHVAPHRLIISSNCPPARISYLVLELLDLGLGHRVFDLELQGAEKEETGESGKKGEGGRIIKCMAAQASTAARYNVMDGRREADPVLPPDSIPTAALTHALSGEAGKTAADREVKKKTTQKLSRHSAGPEKEPWISAESLTSTKKSLN